MSCGQKPRLARGCGSWWWNSNLPRLNISGRGRKMREDNFWCGAGDSWATTLEYEVDGVICGCLSLHSPQCCTTNFRVAKMLPSLLSICTMYIPFGSPVVGKMANPSFKIDSCTSLPCKSVTRTMPSESV